MAKESKKSKGYWIAQVDVADLARYQEYSKALDRSLAPYGGRFLIRTDKIENVEGKARARHIVIEFPSFQAARDCWNSPAYRNAVAIRAPIAAADIVVIEGFDGPQPA